MIINLTIPEESVDLICTAFGWTPTLQNPAHDTMYPDDTPATIPNPETKQKFIKRNLCEEVESRVRQYRISLERRRLTDTLEGGLHIT